MYSNNPIGAAGAREPLDTVAQLESLAQWGKLLEPKSRVHRTLGHLGQS